MDKEKFNTNYVESLKPGSFNEHYKQMAVQPIQLMKHLLSPEEYTGFIKGSMIKYAMRAGRKEGDTVEEDYAKYKYYEEELLVLNKEL